MTLKLLTALLALLALVGCGAPSAAPPTLTPASTPTSIPYRAHAIILFIGDGMGEAQRTAGRWQTVGQDGFLAMDALPVAGWSSTVNVDGYVTDSAAAATAMASGAKTHNGVIGEDVNYSRLPTILEQAQARGMAVGLVSNTPMAHATPAAFAAHVSNRGLMTEIASQMMAAEVDVLLGGGEDDFLPSSATGCYPGHGGRSDGRSLITEAVGNGYTYVCSAAELAAVDPISTSRLLGLFSGENMTRPFSPTLAEMTRKAIGVLSQDPDGFFLMVEGGLIDQVASSADAASVISDVIGLDEAVAVAQSYAATADDVLIIVTADHETGGMSVGLTADASSHSQDGPFSMPDSTLFYADWSTDEHTGANVPITAQGPCANLLTGTHENTYIHDVMEMALEACPEPTLAGPAQGTPLATPGGQ